jgi:beta-glucanase (GH16 family)
VIGDPAAFHTYALEWTRDTLTILYDGKVCLVDRWAPAPPLQKPQPFDKPFSLSLTQALGVGSNQVTPRTPLPASTVVDYVRIWN